MKTITKKIISLALAFMLVLPVAPLVFAQEEKASTTDPSSSLEGEAGRGSEESEQVREEAGENTASSTEEVGLAEIETGNATAAANIVNVVNSNFFNSNVWILFLNNFFQLLTGDIDVRKILESEPTYGGGSPLTGSGFSACDPTLSTCLSPDGLPTLSIGNENTAEIQNDVIVRSDTGSNIADGCDANINTGNAAAAVNVVNLANTNVVNSNYVLLTINNFSDWVGDLILPSSEALTGNLPSSLSSTTAETTASTTLVNENEASVSNDVSVAGDTGNNIAEAPAANIDTGVSAAWSNIINNLNQNFVGGTALYLVFRVYGDWVGDVWNAPEGIGWTEKDGAIEISGALPGTAATVNGGGGTATPANFANTAVTNTNQAAIQNNVSVSALTGANHAKGESKGTCGANIHTGNAFSVANVVNMANTNIFGKNWIVAIINIFGNWHGSVSFGRPNLWIGSRAEIEPIAERSNRARPGSPVKFHYTVANNGDAPASNVVLRQKLGKFFSFASADHGGVYDPATGEISWNLASLARGATLELGSVAVIDTEVPGGDSMLESTGAISSSEADADMVDNTDVIKVVAYRVASNGGLFKTSVPHPMPTFAINKGAQFATTTASSTLGYRIAIKNTGGPAKNAVLLDVITDEKGKVLREKKWNIGDIKADEEIRVEYSVLWNAATPPGKYTNTAQLMAFGGYPQAGPGDGSPVYSPVAKVTIEVFPRPGTPVIAPELLMTPASSTKPFVTDILEVVAPPAVMSQVSKAPDQPETLPPGTLYSKFSVFPKGQSPASLLASLGALPENYLTRANAAISSGLLIVMFLTSLYFRRREELDV